MENRKKDHIKLAFSSQTGISELDKRFYYEPLLGIHPAENSPPVPFLGKTLQIPFWVSSMTGGTEQARKINTNLAKACKEFGMGMGLGSCRSILNDDIHLSDFNMRPVIGTDLPLWANLGISQVESLLEKDQVEKISALVDKLQADGLIIHVNPMQEWMQPEGDRLRIPPIQTIETLLEKTQVKVIVKEVGQGIGPESLLRLLRLPLAAIEFAAFGGTNFSSLELLRNDPLEKEVFQPLTLTGQTAEEMVDMINSILEKSRDIQCRQLIISGGINSFIDGYYLVSKSKMPAIFGQASAMLNYARQSYESLHKYLEAQVRGYRFAANFLKLR